MMSPLLRISLATVRTWTRVYTWRMPRSVREARQAEIESDLWECQTDDAAGPALPVQIIGRLVLGIVDDMRWRAEHVSTGSHRARRTLALSLGAAVLLACLWLGLAVSSVATLQPPAAPDLGWRRTQYPAPPPPPPPPCNPPGMGREFSPCMP